MEVVNAVPFKTNLTFGSKKLIPYVSGPRFGQKNVRESNSEIPFEEAFYRLETLTISIIQLLNGKEFLNFPCIYYYNSFSSQHFPPVAQWWNARQPNRRRGFDSRRAHKVSDRTLSKTRFLLKNGWLLLTSCSLERHSNTQKSTAARNRLWSPDAGRSNKKEY